MWQSLTTMIYGDTLLVIVDSPDKFSSLSPKYISMTYGWVDRFLFDLAIKSLFKHAKRGKTLI